MKRLPAGEYLGRTLRRGQLFGLPLALTAYPPAQVYPGHVHEYPTLFVLLAGDHHDQTRHLSVDQPPLSVVFHPTTEPHSTSVGPKGLVGMNLELTDAWLERCHLNRSGLATDYRLLDSMRARLLGLRLAAACEWGMATKADVEMAAVELMACLVRCPSAPMRAPRWLARAKEFLRTFSHTQVRLHDVAAEVGVHPVYCCRAFHRAVGCTVTAYIRGLRLLEAGQLILTEGRPLAEVAMQAGFADQAHFTRTFSREIGFTPGQLRRMWQELISGRPAGSLRSRNGRTRAVPFDV